MNLKISHALIAMMTIVAISNYLVQIPINDWLTYGAIFYPISFLVTELTNRFHGPLNARKVVYSGFFLGVLLSLVMATPQIAFASGLAFLVSQLVDIIVFNRVRQLVWWWGPLLSSTIASIIDTSIFWTIGFWGISGPIVTLAIGDFMVKMIINATMLVPFRLVLTKQYQR